MQQLRFSENELRNAVNEYCTCGGKGPEDPDACPACMVWHYLVTFREEPREPQIPRKEWVYEITPELDEYAENFAIPRLVTADYDLEILKEIAKKFEKLTEQAK